MRQHLSFIMSSLSQMINANDGETNRTINKETMYEKAETICSVDPDIFCHKTRNNRNIFIPHDIRPVSDTSLSINGEDKNSSSD